MLDPENKCFCELAQPTWCSVANIGVGFPRKFIISMHVNCISTKPHAQMKLSVKRGGGGKTPGHSMSGPRDPRGVSILVDYDV